MKKTTLFLMALSFSVAVFAQGTSKVGQKEYSVQKHEISIEDFKIANARNTVTDTSEKVIPPDTIPPQSFYYDCTGDNLVYSWAFGSFNGAFQNFLSGTSKFPMGAPTMVYVPEFYNIRLEDFPLQAPLGGDRRVTGLYVILGRQSSSLRGDDTISFTASIAPAIKTDVFINLAIKDNDDVEEVYIPDVTRMVESTPVKISALMREGRAVLQAKTFQFPLEKAVSTNAPFSVTLNLPWYDSTAQICYYTTAENCVGVDLYSSLLGVSLDSGDFWYGDPLSGFGFPEGSIQYEQQLVRTSERTGEEMKVGFMPFTTLSGYFSANDKGPLADFQFLPIINTVKVSDNVNDIKFKASVYPSPATREITVASTVDMKNIAIYTIAGQKIKDITPSEMVEVINIEDLTNGIYIVKLDTKEGVITKKVVVNK